MLASLAMCWAVALLALGGFQTWCGLGFRIKRPNNILLDSSLNDQPPAPRTPTAMMETEGRVNNYYPSQKDSLDAATWAGNVLGLPVDPAAPEIKKAYRQLARKWHPDRAKAEKQMFAKERFQDIQLANTILTEKLPNDIMMAVAKMRHAEARKQAAREAKAARRAGATSQFRVGDIVVAKGLTEAAHLNGIAGIVTDLADGTGLYLVNFGGGHYQKRLKPNNLYLKATSQAEAEQRKAKQKQVEAQGDSMLTVEWSGRKLGPVAARASQLAKCASWEFLQVGDFVVAAYDLAYSSGDSLGAVVKLGSLGKLTSDPAIYPITIEWTGRSFGASVVVAKGQFSKCEPIAFLESEDVVRAVVDLTYTKDDHSQTTVQCNSRGVLKSVPAQGNLSIEWSAYSLGTCCVLKDQIAKCSPMEYMLTGDVVKALQDLQYPATDSSDGLVRQGHMGTLQSSPLDDPLLIDWWGYKLGPTSAAKSQVAKCHPREYLIKGDVVKAVNDLDYSNIGMQDAEGGWVREGSVGVIKDVDEGHKLASSMAGCSIS